MLRTERHDDHKQTLLTRILQEHFACADDRIIGALETGAQYVNLTSGETLFRQGEAQDDIYFVLSGRLRAVTIDAAGVSRTLGEIGRGETIGELALFTGERRSASIMALRDATVARVSRPLIERTIAQAPDIALSLTRLVIERFRQRERDRPASPVPVNVCILPISPGVDAMGFARSLRARQPQSLGSIAVLGTGHITESLGADAGSPVWRRHGAVTRYLDAVEEENTAVYLVAGNRDHAWTRFCLQHADEIILLADASADPAPSEIEQRLLLGDGRITIARQTLVLLHAAETRSPRGTARWLTPRRRPRHFHIRPSLEADMARLARIVSGRAVGLVLAGGGARGFAHIGVYEALEEAGIAVDFIGGTSIGALMGTLLSLDLRAPAVRQGVRDGFLSNPRGNITGDYNLLPLLSLIRGTRSRDALATSIRRHAGDDIDIEDTWKSFFVMASNFSTGSEQVLQTGSMARNVAASFAIPGALPPVLMDGQLLFDGGTFNNFPVDVMAGMGVGRIIGVDLSSDDPSERLDFEAIPGALELLRDKLRPRSRQRYRGLPTIPETMMMSSFVTSLARQREQGRSADLLFRPNLPRMGLLDWHRFDEIVHAGRSEAEAILAGMSKETLAAYR